MGGEEEGDLISVGLRCGVWCGGGRLLDRIGWLVSGVRCSKANVYFWKLEL